MAEKQKSVLTKDELWQWQVPCFNFELGRSALLKRALKVGFVTKVGDDQYKVNSDYGLLKAEKVAYDMPEVKA
jgi:hypothetical protein